MINQQNDWSSCHKSGFVPLVSDENCEQPTGAVKNKGFGVQTFSPPMLLRGLHAGWKTDKTPQKKTLSLQTLKAIALLDSWENEDAQEQKETWNYLKKVLDEDRFSYRKLFS